MSWSGRGQKPELNPAGLTRLWWDFRRRPSYRRRGRSRRASFRSSAGRGRRRSTAGESRWPPGKAPSAASSPAEGAEAVRSGGAREGPKERNIWAEATPRQVEMETTGADKDQRLLTLLRVWNIRNTFPSTWNLVRQICILLISNRNLSLNFLTDLKLINIPARSEAELPLPLQQHSRLLIFLGKQQPQQLLLLPGRWEKLAGWL